jgi:hypothetical protein
MRRISGLQALLAALATFLVLGTVSATGQTSTPSLIHQAATGALQPRTVTALGITKTMPFFSDGAIATAQEGLGLVKPATGKSSTNAGGSASGGTNGNADNLGIAMRSYGCGSRDFNPQANSLNGNSGNERVNQDCSFRRQAEEDIVHNPAEPTNFLAGQNDSSLGFNQCGIDFSPDNGLHWGTFLPPFRQRINSPQNMGPGTNNNTARNTTTSDPNNNTTTGLPGTMHTYDAGSDPTVAFDSRGRGYFSCVIFDVNDFASGIYVTESPLAAKGSFFYNVPSTTKGFMPIEDNDPTIFHDKQFITADTYASSPNRDNVYITWTRFDATNSPIYGSMSTDNGKTWSTPQEINGTSTTLCTFPTVGPCRDNQGSDPIVLPNGDLVVVWYNVNTPTVGVNQILAVHCSPTGNSAAGTANLGCNPAPTLVGVVDEAAAPFCSFGRECIPGAFIRTNPFPRIAANTDNGHLYTVYQDYRRRDNNAMEWSIQFSQSVDGGITWTTERTVNPDTGLDHYFAAVDVAEVNGADRVGVSYYRTERVANENSGATFTQAATMTCGPAGTSLCNSDYVLAGGTGLQLPYDFKVVSVTFPPPDGIQAGFNGDYSGLTINKGSDAHPIWSDTRNADPYAPTNGVVQDEDIYTDNVGLPNGQATVAPGTVGKR